MQLFTFQLSKTVLRIGGLSAQMLAVRRSRTITRDINAERNIKAIKVLSSQRMGVCSGAPVCSNTSVRVESLPWSARLGWPQLRLHSNSSHETVEKRLLQLMDMWEVEDAVALLRQSVLQGVVPNPGVVLNLQQQLSNLGEVECLLELHDFLKEHKLTSDTRFFQCLQQAYYNSGRISEGVAVLRLLYHRTRKFADVDVYFTLLTVMLLRHFPDHIGLILSFVSDLKDAEEPVLEPEASLWKCYMLTENWSKADELLLNNEELRVLVPYQVQRILHGIDKADFDRVTVFWRLLGVPFLRQRLRVLVAETLLVELVKKKDWLRLLKSLKHMQSQNLPLHADKLAPALHEMQRHLSPQYDEQIEELRLWCVSLQEGTG